MQCDTYLFDLKLFSFKDPSSLSVQLMSDYLIHCFPIVIYRVMRWL